MQKNTLMDWANPPFWLGAELSFPDPQLALASPNGLLAMGGDLSPQRLLRAYQAGIFPWFEEEPILWWSPDPRAVLFLNQFHLSKSLKKILNRHHYEIKLDEDFEAVIKGCSAPRHYQGKIVDETWITPSMQEAYLKLHTLGFAHAIGVYRENQLIGGIYGVSLGRLFFAESMFSFESNASKIALAYLVMLLRDFHFEFIDCQVPSSHLLSLGATLLPRKIFLEALRENNLFPTKQGKWNALF